MNYAILKSWSEERAEELVAMGVPRAAANEAMHYVEVAAINAESEARKEDQLLLDFKRVGSAQLALRHGVTERTIRDWRMKALRKKSGSNRVA